MRRCKCCRRSLPADSAAQRRYCEHPDCSAERDAYRKAHERARAYNAYRDVVLEAADRPGRRRTQHTGLAVSSRWDEIAKAWGAANVWPPSGLPADRGLPVLDEHGRRLGYLHTVDRLMEEAERPGARPTVPGDHSKREDRNSPGELWLRDDVETAERKARNEAQFAGRRAR